MEFLCHASATDHTASLKNAHTQTRHTEIGRAGQAIVAGTDYDGIEIRHSFAIRVGSESRHNIPFVQVQRGNVGAGRGVRELSRLTNGSREAFSAALQRR
jgi:hypothetical protein